MISILKLITENKILIPRRSKEERKQKRLQVVQKQIQDYIKNGSVGDLNLEHIPIKELPKDLKRVGGNLRITVTDITSLPEGMVIQGNLYANGIPLKNLPDNLQVGKSIGVSNTPVSSIPRNMKTLDFFAFNTPLSEKYTEQEVYDMIKSQGGHVMKVYLK